jgi:hypothetical protein
LRVLALALAASVVAQATGVPGDVTAWLQGGILGLVVVGFLTGKIRRGADYDQVQAENARLRAVMEDRVLPALIRSNEVLGRAADKAGA